MELPWQTITAASGGWFLTAAFVYAVLSGKLVPRSSLDDARHDGQEWRAESRIKDAQIAEKDTQLSHMKELGHLMRSVMNALQNKREDA